MKCTRCGSAANITVTELRNGKVFEVRLCEQCARAREPATVIKPFYSLAEAQRVLGNTKTDVRRLVRSGKLREFQHSGRMMLKADQVDQLER